MAEDGWEAIQGTFLGSRGDLVHSNRQLDKQRDSQWPAVVQHGVANVV